VYHLAIAYAVRYAAICTVLGPFFGNAALAQDECNDILATGLKDTSQNQSGYSVSGAATFYACSLDYNNFHDYFANSDQHSNSYNGSVGYGGFSLGGGVSTGTAAAMSQDQFNEWKTQNCSNSSSSDNESAFQYSAQSVLAPAVVQAWETCMDHRSGLTCWATPHGNNIEFDWNWQSDDAGLPSVQSSNSIWDDGTNSQNIVADNSPIYIGKSMKIFTRTPDHGVDFVLNAIISNRYIDSCSVYVPPEPDPELEKLNGRWCSSQQMTYSFTVTGPSSIKGIEEWITGPLCPLRPGFNNVLGDASAPQRNGMCWNGQPAKPRTLDIPLNFSVVKTGTDSFSVTSILGKFDNSDHVIYDSSITYTDYFTVNTDGTLTLTSEGVKDSKDSARNRTTVENKIFTSCQ
jgi:hypothetical protein